MLDDLLDLLMEIAGWLGLAVAVAVILDACLLASGYL